MSQARDSTSSHAITRRAAASTTPRRGVPALNDEPQRPLRVEEGDRRGGRVGDSCAVERRREEFPPRRVRGAERSDGEVVDRDVTGDHMAPETLLDLERSRTPASASRRTPLDAALDTLDGTIIGGGIGPDEAERANPGPAGRAAAQTRHRAEQHARDRNAVEPHETEELAAAVRVRQRRTR